MKVQYRVEFKEMTFGELVQGVKFRYLAEGKTTECEKISATEYRQGRFVFPESNETKVYVVVSEGLEF